jgi:hypothetical protein
MSKMWIMALKSFSIGSLCLMGIVVLQHVVMKSDLFLSMRFNASFLVLLAGGLILSFFEGYRHQRIRFLLCSFFALIPMFLSGLFVIMPLDVRFSNVLGDLYLILVLLVFVTVYTYFSGMFIFGMKQSLKFLQSGLLSSCIFSVIVVLWIYAFKTISTEHFEILFYGAFGGGLGMNAYLGHFTTRQF